MSVQQADWIHVGEDTGIRLYYTEDHCQVWLECETCGDSSLPVCAPVDGPYEDRSKELAVAFIERHANCQQKESK